MIRHKKLKAQNSVSCCKKSIVDFMRKLQEYGLNRTNVEGDYMIKEEKTPLFNLFTLDQIVFEAFFFVKITLNCILLYFARYFSFCCCYKQHMGGLLSAVYLSIC